MQVGILWHIQVLKRRTRKDRKDQKLKSHAEKALLSTLERSKNHEAS
jgi:hypothetical protein